MLDQWNTAELSSARKAASDEGSFTVSDVSITASAIGLLHTAASGGHAEAQLSLALRQGHSVVCRGRPTDHTSPFLSCFTVHVHKHDSRANPCRFAAMVIDYHWLSDLMNHCATRDKSEVDEV